MSFSRHVVKENSNDDVHKLNILDGLKQAEVQCNNLRHQLRLLGKVLSHNYQDAPQYIENGGGDFVQDNFKFGDSEQLNYPEESLNSSKKAKNTKTDEFIDQEKTKGSSEDVVDKRRKKKSKKKHYCSTSEIEKPVLTLFKKHDRQNSFVGSEDVTRRSHRPTPKIPDTFKSEGDCSTRHVPNNQLKQVVKSNVMPFIAGTSTSRSHNICLNFQEVLAKLKRRQPIIIDTLIEDKVKEQPLGQEEEKPKDDTVNITVSADIAEKQIAKFLSDEERSKKFKEVLRNLYMEFTSLTQQYEQLLKAYSLKESNKTLLKKQLKKLDKILGQKEDEIIVLISMYREVISMKEAASRKTITGGRLQSNPCSLSSNTNLRLKVLLHQIRKLQDHLSRL